MCRLAFFPGETVKHQYIPWFMDWLEHKMGGHGNGIGYFIDGEAYILKGVRLKSELLVEEAVGATIFHTRWATTGSISDKNCHPFHVGDGIYAHNGQFSRWIQAVEYMERRGLPRFPSNITDSFVLATIEENFDREFMEASTSHFGVLLRLNPDETCRVVVTSHSFKMGKLVDTGQLIFASDFPSAYSFVEDVREMKMGSVATISAKGAVFEKGGFKRRYKKKKKAKTGTSSSSQTKLTEFQK